MVHTTTIAVVVVVVVGTIIADTNPSRPLHGLFLRGIDGHTAQFSELDNNILELSRGGGLQNLRNGIGHDDER